MLQRNGVGGRPQGSGRQRGRHGGIGERAGRQARDRCPGRLDGGPEGRYARPVAPGTDLRRHLERYRRRPLTGRVVPGDAAPGRIATGHIATGRIATGRIAADHIATGHIATGAVTSSQTDQAAVSRLTASG